MKIAFYNVTASFIPGGLETYCWEAGRALVRRGHEVEIVAGNRGGAAHTEARLVQFPFRIEQDWPDFGTRFRRLMERLSFSRRSLPYLLAARHDAVIVNKPFDLPILWYARRRGLRAQTVFSSGGTDFFAGDRWFSGSIDHWVSTSHHNASQVLARYGRPVSVLHSGVDVDRFHALPRQSGWRAQRGIPENALVVASLGRLVGLKGLRIIVEAIRPLGEAVHYVVIGEGPEEPALRARAQPIAARVHFEGRVEHARLPEFLSECDLLVQPTLGAEAFGISVVEAMACGLAVFASDLGGLRETVVNGESGRLLPEGDVQAWRDALAQAEADRLQVKRWGAAGRIRVARDFTWDKNAAGLEAMLQTRSNGGV